MTYDSGRNTPHQKSLYSPDSPPPEDYQVRLVSRGVSEYHVGRPPLLNRARDVGDTCLLRKLYGFPECSLRVFGAIVANKYLCVLSISRTLHSAFYDHNYDFIARRV